MALLKPAMSLGRPEDLLALKVEAEGMNGKKGRMSYRILDYYNSRRRVSAMARTTAYPCTSVALLVGMKKVTHRGVVTPEKIAQDQGHFRYVLSRLRQKEVRVQIKASDS